MDFFKGIGDWFGEWLGGNKRKRIQDEMSAVGEQAYQQAKTAPAAPVVDRRRPSMSSFNANSQARFNQMRRGGMGHAEAQAKIQAEKDAINQRIWAKQAKERQAYDREHKEPLYKQIEQARQAFNSSSDISQLQKDAFNQRADKLKKKIGYVGRLDSQDSQKFLMPDLERFTKLNQRANDAYSLAAKVYKTTGDVNRARQVLQNQLYHSDEMTKLEDQERDLRDTAKGLAQLSAPVRGLVGWAGSKVYDGADLLYRGGETLSDLTNWQEAKQAFKKARQSNQRNKQQALETTGTNKSEYDGMLYDIGAGAGQLAEDMAMASVGLSPVVASRRAADTGTSTYLNNREQGKGKIEALFNASGNAIAQYYLEKVPLDNLVKPTGSRLTSGLIGGVLEGVQEGGQEVVDNLFNNRKWDQNVIQAGLMGAGLGSVAKYASDGLYNRAEQAKTQARQDIDAQYSRQTQPVQNALAKVMADRQIDEAVRFKLVSDEQAGQLQPAYDPINNQLISYNQQDMAKLQQLHQQHGNDFTEHLNQTQEVIYNHLLDQAPRDQQGRYQDPITGETWIDEVVDYNGKKAVKTEYQAEDINNRQRIRDDILAKFGGQEISLNEINQEAGVTKKSAGKLAGKSYSKQPLDHVNAKVNSAMHIDELGLTMTNVQIENNSKNTQKNAPTYIKGDTIIIDNGRAYEASLVVKHYPDGKNTVYDVVIQKEIVAPHTPMRDNAPESPVPHLGSPSEQQWVNSDASSVNIAQSDENVNLDIKTKLADTSTQLKSSLDELKARHFKLTGDNDIAFNAFSEAIQDIGNIEGYYDPKTNTVHIGELAEYVLNHEVVHKTLRKHMELRPEIMQATADRFGIDNIIAEYNQKGYGEQAVNGHALDPKQPKDVRLAVEEKVADEFNTYLDQYQKGRANYYANKVGLSPTIRAWFDRIIEGLKEFFGQADKIKQFYAQLETGKFADKQLFGNSEQLLSDSKQLAYKVDPERALNTLKDFDDVLNGRKESVLITNVSPELAQRIHDETGIIVKSNAGYELSRGNAIHINNRHIANSQDVNPLTETDIAELPYVLENPDKIELAKKVRGLDRIRLHKVMNNGHIAVVEVIKKGNALNVVTYFNDTSSGRPNATMSPVDVRPETGQLQSTYLQDNIPQTDENIKYKIIGKDSFVDTVKNSEQVSDKVKARTPDSYHRVISDKYADVAADKYIKSKSGRLSILYSEAIKIAEGKTVSDNPKIDMAKALATARKLDEAGRYDQASDIYRKIAIRARKQGQDIQALAAISRRSPEGIRKMAEKELLDNDVVLDKKTQEKLSKQFSDIQQAQQELSRSEAAYDDLTASEAELVVENDRLEAKIQNLIEKRRSKKWNDPVKGALKTQIAKLEAKQEKVVNELTQKQLANWSDELAEAIQAKNLAEQNLNKAVGKYLKTTSEQLPVSATDKLISMYKAGLLSGAKTHLGNIASNNTMSLLEGVSAPLASAIDGLVSLKTHKRTTSAGGGLHWFRGALKGFQPAWHLLKTGVDLDGVSGKYQDGDIQTGHPEFKINNKLADVLFGTPTRGVFRLMGAGDKFNRYASYERSMKQLADAEAANRGLRGADKKVFVKRFMADPPAQAKAQAVTEGAKSVLDNDTLLSGLHSDLSRRINKLENPIARNTAKIAMATLTPFVRVPTAFLRRAVDFTPIGYVGTAMGTAKGFDQRAFSKGIAEATTGSLLIAGIALAAKQGLIELTGGYPDDPKERERWRLANIQPNSIRFKGNDNYFSLNYLGTFGMFASGAKAFNESKDPMTGVAAGAGNFVGELAEQSFLTGLKGVVSIAGKMNKENIENGNLTDEVNRQLARQAGSVIPTVVKDIAEATDDKQRETFNQPLNQIIARLPYFRKNLPIKTDIMGNELDRNMAGWQKMVDIFRVTPGRNSVVIDEINKLHQSGQNVTFNIPSNTLKLDGDELKLSAEQRVEYKNMIGNLVQNEWQEMIKNTNYQSLNNEERAKVLNKLKEDTRELAKHLMSAKNNLGQYSGKQIDKPNHLSKTARRIAENPAVSADKPQFGSSSSKSQDTSDTKRLVQDHLINKVVDKAADKKYYYKKNDAEYNEFKTEHQLKIKEGSYSRKERILADHKLKKLESGKDFPKEIRDLYELGKNDLRKLVTTSQDGQYVLDEVMKYGDKLASDGLIKRNKFRDKYGRLNIGERVERGSRGRRDSTKLPAIYKMSTSELLRGLRESKASGRFQAVKSYNISRGRSSRPVRRLNGGRTVSLKKR